MTKIRRTGLAALLALFIVLGTAAPISAAGRLIQPDRCLTDGGTPCPMH